MTTINDLYRQLFGRSGTNKGTDIDMAEHGRSGGISTGQPFKFTDLVPYALQIHRDVAGNPIYLGIANTGTATSSASWQIRKLTFDGANNVTAIQYADGDASFDNIWDNRAGLTYV